MPYSLEKEYYKIAELTAKWSLNPEDMEYIILTKEIPVYIFLSNAVLEIGKYTITDHGRILHRPKDVFEYTGLKQLRREDMDRVFRNDWYDIHDFMPDNRLHYTRLTNFKAALKVRIQDLVLKTEDLRELQVVKEIQTISKTRNCGKNFHYENDFKMVKYGDDIFHFGETQSQVIKALYEIKDSDNPWVHVKQLLHQAGSTSTRMTDVFKTQKGWKKLIIGNGKGYYRLDPEIFEKEKVKMAS